MENSELWWGTSYEESFGELPYPIVLLDLNLSYCWSNRAAQVWFAGKPMEEAVRQIFFGQTISTLLDKLSQKSPVLLSGGGLLGNDCLLSPVFAQRELAGCVLTRAEPENRQMADTEQIEQMISTVTNQIRGPVSTMITALAGIERCNNQLSDPDIHQYVKKISTQCYRLLRSSINLKDISLYRYGISEFTPQQQDLCAFFRNICNVVSVMIEKIGIRFRFTVPEGLVVAQFDSEKISAVLFNLISNAAKFIGEDGEITVTLHAANDSAIVTVADNGVGIREGMLDRIFDEYFSYDPRTGGACGDGLGLAICREILREHGGTIAVISDVNRGTKVVFSLPLNDDGSNLVVGDVVADYLYNRFSSMYVILSDVCQVPDVVGR